MDRPAERLASFRRSLGLSQRDFAANLSVSAGLIGSIETGDAPPSRRFLLKISERYNISSDWLLHGRGGQFHPPDDGFMGRRGRVTPPDRSKPAFGDAVYEGEEFAFIRRMDLSVSAGNGLVPVDGGARESLAFSTSWLSRNGINSDLAVLVKVKGDSMSPTIPDGALVLVHVAEKAVKSNGIFAFNRDGQSFVKRLLVGGANKDGRPSSVVVLADNSVYPPEMLSGTAMNDLQIVGRVRCVMTTL